MIDKNSIVKTLQLEDMTHEDQMQVLDSIEKTIKESKEKQKQQLKTNVDFVVQALKNIKDDIENKFEKLDNKLVLKVDQIIRGRDGLPGKDGMPGKPGRDGQQGTAGRDGKDGKDGKDGVGVQKAKVDIDGELVITLTDGTVIEAGKVFTKAVAEKIRVFSNADNRIPELVGQSGKILSNDGVNVKWIDADSSSGTVTSVAMTVPTGLSVTGSPITTSGTLAVSLASGYSIPTTSSQSNWDTAYSWGNHASAGYLTGSSTSTLTNKRITPRVSSTASASSVTPDISAYDVYAFTALAANLTINAPTGSPADGEKITLRILDNGTSRTLTWNATYTAIGVTLPTSTTANKTVYIGCVYNAANTRWDVIAVTTQA